MTNPARPCHCSACGVNTALDSGLFVLKKQEGENLGVREKPWLFLLQGSALSLSGYQSRTSDRETTETEKKNLD